MQRLRNNLEGKFDIAIAGKKYWLQVNHLSKNRLLPTEINHETLAQCCCDMTSITTTLDQYLVFLKSKESAMTITKPDLENYHVDGGALESN